MLLTPLPRGQGCGPQRLKILLRGRDNRSYEFVGKIRLKQLEHVTRYCNTQRNCVCIFNSGAAVAFGNLCNTIGVAIVRILDQYLDFTLVIALQDFKPMYVVAGTLFFTTIAPTVSQNGHIFAILVTSFCRNSAKTVSFVIFIAHDQYDFTEFYLRMLTIIANVELEDEHGGRK